MKRKSYLHCSRFLRLNVVTFALGLLLLVQSIPLGSAVAQTSADDDITSNVNNREVAIMSISSRYDDEQGAFHVFGELINELSSAIKNVRLNATFYDASGKVIGTGFGQAYIDYIRPQERSPFDIAVYDDMASNIRNFSYYSISKSWDLVQESKPSFLGLDLRDMFIDQCGYYHFAGSIANSGKEPAKGVILSAAFYNDKNQITESAFTYVVGKEENLPTGKSVPFELLVDKRVIPEFSYYSLNAHSIEYSSKVLNETFDSREIFDYKNYLPASPPDAVESETKGDIMMVSLDSSSYQSGHIMAEVSGKFPYVDKIDQDSFVLIKLLDASGVVLDRFTAPLSNDGSFSNGIEFNIVEGSEGQVYRVRAEYKERAAEDNFFVVFGDVADNTDSSPSQLCRPSSLVMDHLDVLSSDISKDNITNGNDVGGNRVNATSDLVFSVIADNKLNKLQQFVTIIEVFDVDGNVVFLNIDTSTLYPNTKDQVTASWVPEKKGQYTVESFAISGLNEPRILSHSLRTSFSVV